ncbi:hypothetical protein J6590_023595 [Homalodisca vitripennis]|nr:hypothetical protein J6590_023595 [Homalodisca vitripennis]
MVGLPSLCLSPCTTSSSFTFYWPGKCVLCPPAIIAHHPSCVQSKGAMHDRLPARCITATIVSYKSAEFPFNDNKSAGPARNPEVLLNYLPTATQRGVAPTENGTTQLSTNPLINTLDNNTSGGVAPLSMGSNDKSDLGFQKQEIKGGSDKIFTVRS